MAPCRLIVLCIVALIGVLIQSSSSKNVEDRGTNVKSRSDLDIEEVPGVDGIKKDDNKEGELTLIDRAVKNTGLTKDEIEEVEKRGWRRRSRRGRRRRRSRRRRSRRRRYRNRRRRNRRNRRRRNRRRRSRQRNGRRGSRRKGSSGQSGGGGGIGSHIGSAFSGGLDAVNSGLDLANNLSPGNNDNYPDDADQNTDEEENIY
ncbi:U1 small nuclear ribonucleoprotein 70 kDa-like [Saccostrea cucullata]|uniref:U1 small nuclear ribonucleoprotein 70 kDa-like n=1 Tax=Saccostrea cuccullata TaxID=36930 RepID=UPI002ED0B261